MVTTHIPSLTSSLTCIPRHLPSGCSAPGRDAGCPAPAGRWWPQALCPRRLTGFGIHHCFARSMVGHEVKVPLLENFYADYYTAAGIALASCLAVCPVVRLLGRRGGLLLFVILTALASLLQLGLLNREWAQAPGRRWAGPGVHSRALGGWAARGVLQNPQLQGAALGRTSSHWNTCVGCPLLPCDPRASRCPGAPW